MKCIPMKLLNMQLHYKVAWTIYYFMCDFVIQIPTFLDLHPFCMMFPKISTHTVAYSNAKLKLHIKYTIFISTYSNILKQQEP